MRQYFRVHSGCMRSPRSKLVGERAFRKRAVATRSNWPALTVLCLCPAVVQLATFATGQKRTIRTFEQWSSFCSLYCPNQRRHGGGTKLPLAHALLRR